MVVFTLFLDYIICNEDRIIPLSIFSPMTSPVISRMIRKKTVNLFSILKKQILDVTMLIKMIWRLSMMVNLRMIPLLKSVIFLLVSLDKPFGPWIPSSIWDLYHHINNNDNFQLLKMMKDDAQWILFERIFKLLFVVVTKRWKIH